MRGRMHKDQIFDKFVGTVHKFDILARSYMSKNAGSYVSKMRGSKRVKWEVASE